MRCELFTNFFSASLFDDKIFPKNSISLFPYMPCDTRIRLCASKSISYSYDVEKKNRTRPIPSMNVSINIHGNFGARERELRSEVLDVIDIQLL